MQEVSGSIPGGALFFLYPSFFAPFYRGSEITAKKKTQPSEIYGLYVFQNNFFKPNTRTEKRALTRAQERSTRTRTPHPPNTGESYYSTSWYTYIVPEYRYFLQSIFSPL